MDPLFAQLMSKSDQWESALLEFFKTSSKEEVDNLLKEIIHDIYEAANSEDLVQINKMRFMAFGLCAILLKLDEQLRDK